jgi:hypothetical protein
MRLAGAGQAVKGGCAACWRCWRVRDSCWTRTHGAGAAACPRSPARLPAPRYTQPLQGLQPPGACSSAPGPGTQFLWFLGSREEVPKPTAGLLPVVLSGCGPTEDCGRVAGGGAGGCGGEPALQAGARGDGCQRADQGPQKLT